MAIIIIIDILVVAILCGISLTKGLEQALPFATFVVVFLPIESRLSLGLFELTTHRLVFIVLFLLYIFRGKSLDQPEAKFTTPLKVLMGLHIAWCLVATANSIVVVDSIKKLISVVLEYYVLYFIYCKTITKVKTVTKIMFAMVGAVVTSSVFGAIEAYKGWNVVGLLPLVQHRFGMGVLDVEEGERGLRVQSTFDHPILFGAALAMAIILALFLLTVVQKRWQKIFLYSGLLLMFLNIYKTSSRGPWLDAMMGCFLLLFGAGPQVRKYVLYLAGLCLLVMVVRPGIWQTIEGIYENTFDTNTVQGTSYDYRYVLPRVAAGALSKDFTRALWGYGPESFSALRLEGVLDGSPYVFLSCDDAWVELMVETGYIGLILIILLLAKPAFMAWRDFRKLPEPDNRYSFIFLVCMLIFYFQMLSVGMYSWGQNGYMLWITIAMSVSFDHVRTIDPSISRVEPVPAFALKKLVNVGRPSPVGVSNASGV